MEQRYVQAIMTCSVDARRRRFLDTAGRSSLNTFSPSGVHGAGKGVTICRYCTPRYFYLDYLFVWDIRGDLHRSQNIGFLCLRGIIENISHGIYCRCPRCWILDYRPTSTRSGFQVGIPADCYLRGAAIAVSQVAKRGTLRFTLTFIPYIF
eukprot:6179288-Pleurochrysis_carterae.AAC.1